MPRPQKYDWEDKREICYQLFVEEKLSGSQIVKYFADRFNVPESELPGSNQFLARFRLWGFPSRQGKRTTEEEAVLVARTRELFNQNLPANEIQKTLNDEGWSLDDYHFRVMRKKNGMLKRNLTGYRASDAGGNKRAREADDDDVADAEEGAMHEIHSADPALSTELPVDQTPLSPEEAARRAQRMAELQLQSDEQLRTRKRRRRIRGYGHLPPDTPGMEPRYASETSLDECKAYLLLSNDMYVQVRAEFEAICRELGIIKMTLCADGQWQASKDRLIRENPHLSAVLHPLQPELDKRGNALNCICSDVTKRMRNEAKAMTIAEANNVLGLGPMESKETRRLFYEILDADHFTTVVACGKEHMLYLREQWYAKSDVIQQAMLSGDPQQTRAVDLLYKDARKRYCDDQSRKNPEKKQLQKQYGPGPGPAQGFLAKNGRGQSNHNRQPNDAQQNEMQPEQPRPLSPARSRLSRISLRAVGPAWAGHEVPPFRTSTIADLVPPIDFDLDPMLTAATHGPPWPPVAHAHEGVVNTPAGHPSTSIPAYFRLAPTSNVVGPHQPLWLGRLSSHESFSSLQQAATSKAEGLRLMKVHGIVKNADGSEDSYLVENDEELAVYLGEAGEKAVFTVQLEGGYA